MKHG
jgi:hypothetical protein